MEKYLKKKLLFKGVIKLETGLHIGDSTENVQIGGVDAPVVRRRDNNQPFIPGSSIKGKLRCLLEQTRGAVEVGQAVDEQVNEVFGFAKEDKPSKLIVRDAYLTAESQKELGESEFTDFPYTEVKFENTIDRIKGTAGNPRKIERVPVGTKFDLKLILNIWNNDDEAGFIRLLQEGVGLLESDYLGGSGSRGYGQVSIQLNWESPDVLYENNYIHA